MAQELIRKQGEKKIAEPNERGKQSQCVMVFLSNTSCISTQKDFGETPSLQFEGEYRYSSKLSGEIPQDPLYPRLKMGNRVALMSQINLLSLWNTGTLACQKNVRW